MLFQVGLPHKSGAGDDRLVEEYSTSSWIIRLAATAILEFTASWCLKWQLCIMRISHQSQLILMELVGWYIKLQLYFWIQDGGSHFFDLGWTHVFDSTIAFEIIPGTISTKSVGNGRTWKKWQCVIGIQSSGSRYMKKYIVSSLTWHMHALHQIGNISTHVYEEWWSWKIWLQFRNSRSRQSPNFSLDNCAFLTESLLIILDHIRYLLTKQLILAEDWSKSWELATVSRNLELRLRRLKIYTLRWATNNFLVCIFQSYVKLPGITYDRG